MHASRTSRVRAPLSLVSAHDRTQLATYAWTNADGSLGSFHTSDDIGVENGVHHADAVVWGPVYRTRLNLRGRRESVHHLHGVQAHLHLDEGVQKRAGGGWRCRRCCRNAPFFCVTARVTPRRARAHRQNQKFVRDVRVMLHERGEVRRGEPRVTTDRVRRHRRERGEHVRLLRRHQRGLDRARQRLAQGRQRGVAHVRRFRRRRFLPAPPPPRHAPARRQPPAPRRRQRQRSRRRRARPAREQRVSSLARRARDGRAALASQSLQELPRRPSRDGVRAPPPLAALPWVRRRRRRLLGLPGRHQVRREATLLLARVRAFRPVQERRRERVRRHRAAVERREAVQRGDALLGRERRRCRRRRRRVAVAVARRCASRVERDAQGDARTERPDARAARRVEGARDGG
eukprot:31485-Pelagococcus_subviridis.AAC.7